jgi:hypothetical protein
VQERWATNGRLLAAARSLIDYGLECALDPHLFGIGSLVDFGCVYLRCQYTPWFFQSDTY